MDGDAFDRAVERAERRAEEEHRRLQRERYERMRTLNRTAFRIHASVFVAAQVLLIAIWALTWQFDHGTAYPWFIYPLLGWGIGLIAHYVFVRSMWLQPAPSTHPEESE